MKTIIASLILLFTLHVQATAQKGLPGFGKVDKADLLMQTLVQRITTES